MASIPQDDPNTVPRFENSNQNDTISIGFRRAKLAWYTIDPSVFFRTSSVTHPGVDNKVSLPNGGQFSQQSYHYSREILEKEVFPNNDPQYGSQITNLSILDLAYYPDVMGSLSLRKLVSKKLLDDRGIFSNPDEIMITQGSAEANNLVIQALTDPGDTVIPDRFGQAII